MAAFCVWKGGEGSLPDPQRGLPAQSVTFPLLFTEAVSDSLLVSSFGVNSMHLNRLSAVAVVAAAALSAAANAALVVGWTMPTAFPTGTGNVPTGTTYLPPGPNGAGVADQGANFLGSQLSAVKSLAASTYTSPAGNGSQYSFSANNWSPGDSFQISFSATGYSGLSLSWDQARSSTGPVSFKVMMSVNGGTFTQLQTYTVLQSGGGGAPATWSSTTYNSIYTNTINALAGTDNAASVVIRFVNNEAVASAASGSNRIDNIMVNGTLVPAPGAAALVGLAGLIARRRR